MAQAANGSWCTSQPSGVRTAALRMMRASRLPLALDAPPPENESGDSEMGVIEIPRGFPLLRGPVIEVGPQHDLTPTLNTLAQLQNFFHAQTMHEFHEEAKTYLQRIYSDFDRLVDQVGQIGAHEKYLDERFREIATFALNLRNDTVSFAQDVLKVLNQQRAQMERVTADCDSLKIRLQDLNSVTERLMHLEEGSRDQAAQHRVVMNIRGQHEIFKSKLLSLEQITLPNISNRAETAVATTQNCSVGVDELHREIASLKAEFNSLRLAVSDPSAVPQARPNVVSDSSWESRLGALENGAHIQSENLGQFSEYVNEELVRISQNQGALKAEIDACEGRVQEQILGVHEHLGVILSTVPTVTETQTRSSRPTPPSPMGMRLGVPPIEHPLEHEAGEGAQPSMAPRGRLVLPPLCTAAIQAQNVSHGDTGGVYVFRVFCAEYLAPRKDFEDSSQGSFAMRQGSSPAE